MIQLVDLKSPQAVGLKILGKIEKVDIQRVFSEVDKKLAATDKLSIYVEVDDFKGISFEALVEDIKRGLPKFKSFSKKAVVSPSQWHKLVVEVGDKLFPSVEVRHFEPSQRQAAMAWVVE